MDEGITETTPIHRIKQPIAHIRLGAQQSGKTRYPIPHRREKHHTQGSMPLVWHHNTPRTPSPQTLAPHRARAHTTFLRLLIAEIPEAFLATEVNQESQWFHCLSSLNVRFLSEVCFKDQFRTIDPLVIASHLSAANSWLGSGAYGAPKSSSGLCTESVSG